MSIEETGLPGSELRHHSLGSGFLIPEEGSPSFLLFIPSPLHFRLASPSPSLSHFFSWLNAGRTTRILIFS